MSKNNPFVTPSSTLVGPEVLQKLNDSLKALDVAERETLLLQQAGVDQTVQLQQLQASRAQVLQFKSTYFPGQ